MYYSSAETEYLIELLRCAVKREKNPQVPANFDWNRLVEISKEQQVYSIIACVLNFDEVPDDVLDELKKYTQNELLKMIAMRNELEIIEEELKNKEIKFMLLKGGIIRNYYPLQKMRQMSDFDVLYDVSKRKELIEIMINRGYSLDSVGGNSDDFHKKPYYTFEFHHELFKDVYGFCPDFEFVWENASVSEENEYEYNMSKEDLYLHSIAHMYKHNIFGGFGIRFLVDTYLIVKAESASWNRQYIDLKLGEMKLTEFEKLISDLSVRLLDGEELSDEQIEFFDKNIMHGVYGAGELKVDIIYDDFMKKYNSDSALKYFLARVFPRRAQMENIYTVLKKKPHLLWYYYLKRISEKMFVSRKRVFDEIKTVNKIKKENKNN